MTLGEKIKQLRTNEGLSQEELGNKIGIHYTHISRYERNQAIPSVEALKNLSQLFDVSIDYLLFEDVEKIALEHIQDEELLHQFQEVDRLNEDVREKTKFLLRAILTQQVVQTLASTSEQKG